MDYMTSFIISDDQFRSWYLVDGVLFCDELPDISFPCPNSSDVLDILIQHGYIKED